MESKQAELRELESGVVVKRLGMGDGEISIKGNRLLVMILTNSRALIWSTVTIVNNALLCTWKLLREILNVLTKKKW